MTNTFLDKLLFIKNKEDGKRYIIDGQQHPPTTIIFLDILRTKFKEIADSTNNNDANDDSKILMLNILDAYLKASESSIYLWVVLIKSSSLNMYKTWSH